MKCPCCKSELVVASQARLRTLEEHVSDPNGEVSLKNKWVCSDKTCPTHRYGVRWNDYGEKYSRIYRDDIEYIGNNDAPFGSLERKINVEVRKNDENLHWRVGKFHLELDWVYKSDMDGNILSKKPSFKLWINNTLYISGIRMLIYSITSYYREKSWSGKARLEKFEYPKYANFRKDWWRWVAPFILRIVDHKTYMIAKKEK